MPARRGRRVNWEGWIMVNKLQDTEGRAQILGKYGGNQLLLFIYIFTHAFLTKLALQRNGVLLAVLIAWLHGQNGDLHSVGTCGKLGTKKNI